MSAELAAKYCPLCPSMSYPMHHRMSDPLKMQTRLCQGPFQNPPMASQYTYEMHSFLFHIHWAPCHPLNAPFALMATFVFLLFHFFHLSVTYSGRTSLTTHSKVPLPATLFPLICSIFLSQHLLVPDTIYIHLLTYVFCLIRM